MKVLLVNSPYIYPHRYAAQTEPLGILYLAASLRDAGFLVEIYDPTLEVTVKRRGGYYYGGYETQWKEKILAFLPDVVGISVNSHLAFNKASKFCQAAKFVLKQNVITVIGGVYPSVYGSDVLSRGGSIDYAIQGEGERSLTNLIKKIAENFQDETLLDGVIYRKDGEIVTCPKMSYVKDLNSLPFPARDLAPVERYMQHDTVLYGLGMRPKLSLLTSRACPYTCRFCNVHIIQGKLWRPRSPENVLAELDEMVYKYRAREMFIMDDNFNFDIERAKRICDGMIKRGYRLRWNTPNGISVKGVDLELARLMKRAGCVNVVIAVESGSEYVRNEIMGKYISNEEIYKGVRCFNKAGIPAGGTIILGMPGEARSHVSESLKFYAKLPLSFVNVTFATPFRGTNLYQDLLKRGFINENDAPPCDLLTQPVFETEHFSKKDLLRLRGQMLAHFYLTHIPRIAKEFFTGRLNWMGLSQLKRVFLEKFSGVQYEIN